MGAAATPYASTFVAGGLPSDFLTQLNAAAAALDASLTTHGVTKTTRSGAATGLSSASARGRQAVNVLDSLVEPQLAGDATLLAQWRTAKRIGGKVAPITKTSVDAAAKGIAAAPVAAAARENGRKGGRPRGSARAG